MYHAKYYAHGKTCVSFCIKLQFDYYIKKLFIKILKILPIMLALCSMLSETYYAQNYGGIMGLGLVVGNFTYIYIYIYICIY